MKRRNIYAFFFLFLTAQFLAAQIKIHGQIQDAETGKTIAYAQIRSDSGWGTISNADGNFVIKLPSYAMLRISHIGYEDRQILSSGLEDSVIIRLTARQLELDEVVIMPVEAEDLLRDAIAAIPENHGHDPIIAQAFYREFLQVGDSGVSLNEAVIEVYHVANQEKAHEASQASLIKGRRSEAEMPIDHVSAAFGGGGIQAMAGTPVIGNPKAEAFLGKKAFKNYVYNIQEVIQHNGRDTYVITFDQDRKLRKRLYQGTIYLDMETLAFAQIDYRISQRGKKFRFGQVTGLGGRALKAALRVLGVKINLADDQGTINYTSHLGHWYLSSVHESFRLRMEVKQNDSLQVIPVFVDQDFVMTRLMHEYSAQEIPFDERIDPENSLSEQVGTYDENFWESYNYIPISTPLYEAAKGWQK